MSKSTGLIIGLPFILIALIMQVYSLWGWFSRDGWIQYFLMAEVYILMFITLLYLRSIFYLKNSFVSAVTLLLVPLFYFTFTTEENGLGAMVNSLWYINIIISIIASAWVVVLGFGLFWSGRELTRQKIEMKSIIAFVLLISFSILITYFIKTSQLTEELLIKLWETDKLRTSWFLLEPVLVLSFSLISIYLYLIKKSITELKHEYIFMALVIVSSVFEYMINGFSLVTARTIVYFLGLYSFINLIKNKNSMNYFLISIFVILVALHLNYYSAAPNFFLINNFIPFLHNALIESIKLFIVIYIFIVGWNSVSENRFEFRLIMILVPIIAYTYTTQAQGYSIELYDIGAITAMLKLTALFMMTLYGFYFFRDNKKTSTPS